MSTVKPSTLAPNCVVIAPPALDSTACNCRAVLAVEPAGCCDQTACCEPSDKAACCGTEPQPAACGCQ